jgi:hypothetical protein
MRPFHSLFSYLLNIVSHSPPIAMKYTKQCLQLLHRQYFLKFCFYAAAECWVYVYVCVFRSAGIWIDRFSRKFDLVILEIDKNKEASITTQNFFAFFFLLFHLGVKSFHWQIKRISAIMFSVKWAKNKENSKFYPWI